MPATSGKYVLSWPIAHVAMGVPPRHCESEEGILDESHSPEKPMSLSVVTLHYEGERQKQKVENGEPF